MPQDPPQLDQIAQALSAFQQAGKPSDLLPKVQQFVQARYDQLNQGGFWKDPNNAGIGHSLRSMGYASDPSQGGTIGSQAAPSSGGTPPALDPRNLVPPVLPGPPAARPSAPPAPSVGGFLGNLAGGIFGRPGQNGQPGNPNLVSGLVKGVFGAANDIGTALGDSIVSLYDQHAGHKDLAAAATAEGNAADDRTREFVKGLVPFGGSNGLLAQTGEAAGNLALGLSGKSDAAYGKNQGPPLTTFGTVGQGFGNMAYHDPTGLAMNLLPLLAPGLGAAKAGIAAKVAGRAELAAPVAETAGRVGGSAGEVPLPKAAAPVAVPAAALDAAAQAAQVAGDVKGAQAAMQQAALEAQAQRVTPQPFQALPPRVQPPSPRVVNGVPQGRPMPGLPNPALPVPESVPVPKGVPVAAPPAEPLPAAAPPPLVSAASVPAPLPADPKIVNVNGMGQGIADNLYGALWQKVKTGDVTEGGQPSAVLQVAKNLYDNGHLTTPDQFKAVAQDVQAIRNQGLTGPAYQDALKGVVGKYSTPVAPTVAAPEAPKPAPKAAPAATNGMDFGSQTKRPFTENANIPPAVRDMIEYGKGDGAGTVTNQGRLPGGKGAFDSLQHMVEGQSAKGYGGIFRKVGENGETTNYRVTEGGHELHVALNPDQTVSVRVQPVQAETGGMFADPHPSAPGNNNAARAIDGKYMPAPETTVAPVASPAVPAALVPEPAVAEPPVPSPGAGGLATAPGPAQEIATPGSAAGKNMAGSVNLDKVDASPDAKARMQAVADAHGLSGKAPVSFEQTKAAARALNLTHADLAAIPEGQTLAGQFPSVAPSVLDHAVRELHADAAQSVDAADAAHAAAPTPQTLQTLVQASQNLRRSALANDSMAAEAGRTLGQRRMTASAFEGEQQARDLFKPVADPPAPKAAGYGANNKFFTKADADAARQRILAASSRVNSGIDPALMIDAVKVGGYHLESGLRVFGDWAKQMKSDIPTFSDADLQTVWANVRAEAQKRTGLVQSPRTTSDVFADQMGQRLGREGAAGFMTALQGPNGETGLLDKLLSGQPLAPAEQKTVTSAYLDNARAQTPGSPKAGPVKTVNDLVTQARQDMQAQARLSKPALGPQEAFVRTLNRQIGVQPAQVFRKSLAAPDGSEPLLGKLATGQPLAAGEQTQIGQAYLAVQKPPTPPAARSAAAQSLFDIVKTTRKAQAQEAAATKAAQARQNMAANAKNFVREQLLKTAAPEQVPAITQDLAGVAAGDTKGLANALSTHSQATLGQNLKTVMQSGLLSGPQTLGKIGIAHTLSLAAEELKRPFAAAVSGGRVQGMSLPAVAQSAGQVVRRGLPEAATILKEGPGGLQLRGQDRFHTPGHPLATEFAAKTPVPALSTAISGAVRAPLRVHAAMYHLFKTAALERGLTEQAALMARAEAKAQSIPAAGRGAFVAARTQYHRANVTEDMLKKAVGFTDEQTFVNNNRAHSALKAATSVGGPAAKAGLAVVSPFTKVPSNLAGKSLEYAGGAVYAPARALAAKLRGETLSDTQKTILANTFGRGVVGTGLMTAGYYLAQHHLLNAANPKQGEYGSVNAGGRKFEVGQLEPIAGPLMLGAKAAELGQQAQQGTPVTGSDLRDTAVEYLKSQPLVRANSTLNELGQGNYRSQIGSMAGMAVPTLFSQIAAQTDPAHAKRDKSGPLDYIKNRIPGLRETLPVKTDLLGRPLPEPDALYSTPQQAPGMIDLLMADMDRRQKALLERPSTLDDYLQQKASRQILAKEMRMLGPLMTQRTLNRLNK